jgi:voltage-gated potassium channel
MKPRAWARIRWLVALVAASVAYGVFGYMVFEGWSLPDSLYMTLIVLSTVGLKEVQPLDASGQIFTATLMVLGVAIVLVTVTAVASWVTADQLGSTRRRKRMQKRIDAMTDHTIICAYGRVGRAAARELVDEGRPFVVVDPKEELQERMEADGVAYLVEDPSMEDVLNRAGVGRAKGLLCAVDSDATNVYITLMARSINPDLFIVARASEPGSDVRLQKAGANRVVSPFVASGREMAWMAMDPALVEAVGLTAQSRSRSVIVEELLAEEGSELVGATVADAAGSRIPVAVRHLDGRTTANPTSDMRLAEGDVLIVLYAPEESSV